jgi:flagellar hook-basal body complex protein FliE
MTGEETPMDIKANSLYQEMQAMAMQASAAPVPMGRMEVSPSGGQFAEMLGQAINNVNGLQGESRALQNRFEMGDPNLSLVDVMVAKEKSGIAFEATVQVRNKLLEAYKTIMNMPV